MPTLNVYVISWGDPPVEIVMTDPIKTLKYMNGRSKLALKILEVDERHQPDPSPA